MKYVIKRASEYDIKPCEESFCIESEKTEYGQPWYININTLEELQCLIKKYGELVVDKDRIIIYDDYLE